MRVSARIRVPGIATGLGLALLTGCAPGGVTIPSGWEELAPCPIRTVPVAEELQRRQEAL